MKFYLYFLSLCFLPLFFLTSCSYPMSPRFHGINGSSFAYNQIAIPDSRNLTLNIKEIVLDNNIQSDIQLSQYHVVIYKGEDIPDSLAPSSKQNLSIEQFFYGQSEQIIFEANGNINQVKICLVSAETNKTSVIVIKTLECRSVLMNEVLENLQNNGEHVITLASSLTTGTPNLHLSIKNF